MPLVHVIGKSAWRLAIKADRAVGAAIGEWHKVAVAAGWRNLADLRRTYPSADFVDPYTVFNIQDNRYRLIVKIEYRWQMIFVKHLLTHAEYDKGNWKK